MIPFAGRILVLLSMGFLAVSSAQEAGQSPALIQDIQDTENQLKQVQQELSRLQQKRAETAQELQQRQQEEKRLKGEIEALEKKIRGRSRQLDIFNYNLQVAFPKEQQKLSSQIQALQAEQERIDRLTGYLLRESISLPARSSPLEARRSLIAQTLLQRLFPVLMKKKQHLSEQLTSLKAGWEKIERDIQLDQEWVQSAQARLQALDASITSASQQLEQSAQARRVAQQELAKLKDEQQALHELIARIQKGIPPQETQPAQPEGFRQQRGQLLWPVQGEVVRPFGARKHPEFDLVIDNRGVDIAASPGQEVRAAADGSLVFSGTLPGYGSLVMLHHGENFFTFYTPVVAAELSNGQPVKKGDIIGRLQEVQNSDRSVLHFEVRAGEKALNPTAWLIPKP